MDWVTAIGLEAPHTPTHVLIFRVFLAGLLGGVVGFEREARRRAAGLRTHILVASAAALFTLIALELFYLLQEEQAGGRVTGDPIRAIEAVTAGVAFLGAGVIFRSRQGVKGLTTGAGMWLAGAIGVAVAGGYYPVAVFATVLAIIVLAILGAAEDRLVGGKNATSEDEPDENTGSGTGSG